MWFFWEHTTMAITLHCKNTNLFFITSSKNLFSLPAWKPNFHSLLNDTLLFRREPRNRLQKMLDSRWWMQLDLASSWCTTYRNCQSSGKLCCLHVWGRKGLRYSYIMINVSMTDKYITWLKFYKHSILCEDFNSLTVCFGIAWGC